MPCRTSRAVQGLLVALLVLVGLVAPGASPAGGQDPESPPPSTGLAPPAASIVVELGTGQVVTAANEREPLPPASTTKVLTALLARQHLEVDAEITVAPVAALAPPRRLRLPPESVWGVHDLIYAMMHCSCNDAAWALGAAVAGGDMAAFPGVADEMADRLGLADGPLLRDPAGLDDERSWNGGNLMSARDLAIAARAYMADDVLREVAAAPEHRWTGPSGEDRSVRNLNSFLDTYEGAIGLKTGFTSRARRTFIAAAERDGRTLVAVVLGSDDHYAHARQLLDAGFLLAAAGEVTDDVLPEVPEGLVLGAPTTTTEATTTEPETTTPAASPTGDVTPGDAPPDGAVAAPVTPTATGDDGELPVDPIWLGAGGGAVLAGGAAALAARRRSLRHTIDRRPARPRLRDRRRARRRARARAATDT